MGRILKNKKKTATDAAAKFKKEGYTLDYGDNPNTYVIKDKEGEIVRGKLGGLGVDEKMLTKNRRGKKLIGKAVESELGTYKKPKPKADKKIANGNDGKPGSNGKAGSNGKSGAEGVSGKAATTAGGVKPKSEKTAKTNTKQKVSLLSEKTQAAKAARDNAAFAEATKQKQHDRMLLNATNTANNRKAVVATQPGNIPASSVTQSEKGVFNPATSEVVNSTTPFINKNGKLFDIRKGTSSDPDVAPENITYGGRVVTDDTFDVDRLRKAQKWGNKYYVANGKQYDLDSINWNIPIEQWKYTEPDLALKPRTPGQTAMGVAALVNPLAAYPWLANKALSQLRKRRTVSLVDETPEPVSINGVNRPAQQLNP